MQSAFRECLDRLDVETARKAWAAAFPAYPPLGDDGSVLKLLHYARTSAESMRLQERAYSHRWLLERGFPSGLPDHMRPSAERMYPRVEGCVGISTRTQSALAREVRGAMEYAVEETYADGHRHHPHVVKARMMERRSWVLRT